MSIKVQKYIANMGKSVVYSTADVLSKKFEYANNFKNENQEVFKTAYKSIKDYRTTFARIKKAVTDNKVMDAARVGFDSIVYSVTTGDFYAKSKETEIINKYGGNLMQDMDIDDDDFDFDKQEDVTSGDMVIATAVKKNSKISAAITTEAIVKTGKAQMDVSKENTMLLYTQNERLINKLDGGLTNITQMLKQSSEENARVQNQMNENLNKFMTNVDNNVTKLTKQMDELLEMQRTLYSKQTATDNNGKKKVTYEDIIDSSGVINIKEYFGNVKRNAGNELMNIPGLSMLLGSGGIEGSNMLALMLANPTRSLSNAAINKMLGKKFDDAAKSLNKTLENVIPTIIAKANASGKKSDNGIYGILGRILGVKTGSNEYIDTAKYNKGPVPFDGIARKSIVEVIPYYLRKMTSAITGGEEMVFDYKTGKWTSMKAAKREHDNLLNTSRDQTVSLLKAHLQAGTGRSFDMMYSTADQANSANLALQSLALKLQAAGSFGAIRENDLSSQEKAIFNNLKTIYKRSEEFRYERDKNGNITGFRKGGTGGPDLASLSSSLLSFKRSQDAAIKQLNETGGLALLAASEGITGNLKDYHGKSYVDAKGDMKERHIQEMPTAQVLLKAKDEYGVTLYQYLRSMGSSLNYIRAYSTYLGTLPYINRGIGGGGPDDGGTPPTDVPTIDIDAILHNNSSNDEVNYSGSKNLDRYASNYYSHIEKENKQKEKERHERMREELIRKAREKGKSLSFVNDIYNDRSEGDDVALSRLVSDYYGEGGEHDVKLRLEAANEQNKKEREKWRKFEEIVGRDNAKKFKTAVDKFDPEKGLSANLAKAQGTTEKLLIMGKWMTHKTNLNVMDKVTGTIVKTDAWLRNLIYGQDLKPDDQKKSLFQLMKDHTKEMFDGIKKTVEEGFDKLKETETYKKIKEKVDAAKRKIFGVVNSEGDVEEEGLLSYFTSGFRKGMAKNRDDVHAMWKREIEEAKRLAGMNKESDTESTSTVSRPTPQLPPSYNTLRSNIMNRLSALAMSDNPYVAAQANSKLTNLIQYRNYNSAKNAEQTGSDRYYRDAAEAADRRNAEIARLETAIANEQAEIDRLTAKNERSPLTRMEQNVLDRTRAKLQQNQRILDGVRRSAGMMFAGGINKTGRPFQSVLSAGEYLNGNRVEQTGVYTIPKNGVVYNPASASTRSRQAANERAYLRNLKTNANANDNLSPIENVDQVDISKLTDWNTLTDSKQRAAFLGNMASRGVLGGVAGLLVGGPLLGAAVGAASTLSKSTGSFAELLFGDVEKDSNGDIILDANGNPKRKVDSGLISTELQKAAPDMAKGGMAGLAAGLLTPLGPLGGLLIGSGIGFAKNAEMFQGSLFGDKGIFSKENVDKLKKGAKNMGIGAAAGALFLPGPFGLIGSALIGATAGYVTSTDKFKDFLLGEEGPDGKRKGGVKGALYDNILRPMKDFGKTIVDKTMDELFGPEGDDGERNTDKGLFGAIRANVIRPMTDGAQSIFKELTNTISDIKDFTSNMLKRIKASMAGNDALGGIFGTASKIAKGAIGFAGRVGRFATKPFRMFGDEGLGGMLKSKRVRSGRADDMTARERAAWRGKRGMAAIDEWSDTDARISEMSMDDLTTMLNVLEYDNSDIDSMRNSAYNVLGQTLRDNMHRGDVKRVIKMLKAGRAKDAERFINTRNLSPEARDSVAKALKEHKTKLDRVDADVNFIESNGLSAQQYLLSKGINIDISDAKKRKSLKNYLTRELNHNGMLTDEELAFDAEKKFWNGAESPLKTVNEATNNIERILEAIHYDLSIGGDYDKLSKDDQAKYGSRAAYVESVKNSRANIALKNIAAGDKFVVGEVGKGIGATNRNSLKRGNFIVNDIINDYLPFYTGNLKNTMEADNRIHELIDNKLNEIIDMACQTFDGLAMQELCVTERVEDDITRTTQKIMASQKCDESTARSKIKTIKRSMTVVRNDKPYDFEMTYTISADGSTLTPTARQPRSYEMTKQEFIRDYVKDHAPNAVESSYMSAMDTLSNIVRFSVYLSPGKLPIPIRDLIKKHAVGLVKGAIKGVKKIGFEAIMALGAHGINDDSYAQKLRNYQYELEAEKAWKQQIAAYQRIQREYEKAGKKGKVITGTILDKIAESLNLGSSFGTLTVESEIQKVHDEYVSLFIQNRKNNQVLGRGLLGGIAKGVDKLFGNHISGFFKKVSALNKTLFNANAEGTKEDKKAKLMESLKKKAEVAWTRSFNVKKYHKLATKRLELAASLYPDKTWQEIVDDEEMYHLVHNTFVDEFVQGRFNKLMDPIFSGKTIAERIREKLTGATIHAGVKIASTIDKAKSKINKAILDRRKVKAIEAAIENNDERLDEIAAKKFNMRYSELDDEEKETVHDEFFVQYGSKLGSAFSIKMRGKIRQKVKSSNPLKSGVRNAFAGKLENVRKWKEDQQMQDTFIGKIFDRLDARQLRKDKENFEGKKDSKLAKIMKWLFVGGIAVPFVVGFVKKDLLPAIHEKIQPWLKKAKDKLFGVKNTSTGEYEGGVISGIVNPIRHFFKDKFTKVRNWIYNEGEFSNENTGFKGLVNNLKGIGEYLVDRWKVGFAQIYGELVPKILYNAGKNAIPMLSMVLKGFGAGLKDFISGNSKSANNNLDFASSNSETVSFSGGGSTIYDGKGNAKKLTNPNITMKLSTESSSASGNKITATTNNNGTKTFANEATGVTATSTNEGQYYSIGKNKNGVDLYKNAATGITYVKDADTGSYVRVTDYQKVNDEKLLENTAFNEMIEKETNGETNPNTKDARGGYATNRALNLLMHINNYKILGKAKSVTKAAKAIRSTAGILKHMMLPGKIVGSGVRAGVSVADKATNVTAKAQEGLTAKIIDAIDSMRGHLSTKINEVLTSEKVSKVLGEKFTKKAKDISEKIEKFFSRFIKSNSDEIAKNSAKAATKTATKALSIISIIADFLLGMDNCRNILGIVNSEVSMSERITAGVINMIPSLIMSIGELIGIGTAGVGGAVTAGTILLGIIGTVFLMVPTLRAKVVDGIIKILEGCGVDMEELKKRISDAQSALEATNEELGTNMNIEEYNKYLGNETVASKIGSRLKEANSEYFLGYSGETKNAITAATEGMESKGNSDKVKQKLIVIFSTIWTNHYKDFDFYTKESGEGLSSKQKFNLNHTRFNDAASRMTSTLMTLLLQEDVSVIEDVYSNVCEFTGPIDSVFNLNKVYKDGKNHPQEQFNIDDEHASWKRVKSIAGICAVINDIFYPLGKKSAVTEAVVETMLDVYFTDTEVEAIKNENDTLYTFNTSKLDGSNAASSAGSTGTPGNIPTNANANNKLSPLNPLTNPIDALGYMLSGVVHNSINGITNGGFANIGDIMTSLIQKNIQTNRKIDQLRVLPTEAAYWKIDTDDKHPFASALYEFTENISRVIKAPFSLAASMNASTANVIASSAGSSTTTVSSGSTASAGKSTNIASANKTASTTSSNSGSKLKTAWSMLTTGIKSLFGKGKGDSDESDPFHIYQRDFTDSYNTIGDSGHQSVADSGCGPASAASVLRMYGKKGNMNNAVNFALRNKYKEKDGGTYPEYFSHYLGQNGISTNTNASNEEVIRSLASGKPVILMGQDRSGSNSPYGSKYSHYVVARGLDRNGNVIIEDSEDKRGNTRYSLADTLRNTSVRITTGSGKFGRASGDNTSVSDRYITNVNAVISGSVSSVIASAISAITGNNGNVTSEGGATGNVGKALGKSLTMTDEAGNTRTVKITQDEVEIYNMLTKECGLSAAAACGALGNWEVECGINSIREIATKGVIYYGGGLMQWTPGDKHTSWASKHGYGNDPWCWEANLAHAKEEITQNGNWSNPKNASPSFESKGLKPVSSFEEFKKLSDPEDAAANFERVYEVSGDWNGINSEGVHYSESILYDRLRRLCAKILYGLIVQGKSDGANEAKTGTGRGRKIIANTVGRSRPKYGRADDTSTTNKDTSTSPSTTVTTSDPSSSSTSTSGKTSVASGLISKLTEYTTKLYKGVYGNFYDALYGNEATNSNSPGSVYSGVIGETTIPYETYKNWKQGSWGIPAPWASKSIACGGNVSCESSGCAVVSCAILLAHSGAVMEPDFDPGVFIDDVISRGATNSAGAFYTPGQLINYKNQGIMSEAKDYNSATCEAFGSNATSYGHTSWDDIYKTLLGELEQGHYVMIKVTISHSGMHFVALDYIDTSTKEIYIMDPGSTTKTKLSEYGADSVLGYASFNCSTSSASQYILDGTRAASGRAKKNSKNKQSGINRLFSVPERQVIEHPTGRGANVLRSYDDVRASSSAMGRRSNNSSSGVTGRAYSGTRYNNSASGTQSFASGSSFDFGQLIQLIQVIANNSDKMDAITALLGTIASNTENTITAVNNTTQKPGNSRNSNGLAAIRNALDSNNSGEDIIKAVYQIAQS